MKRTFNFTGRRSIARKDVTITVRQEGKEWAFDAELRIAAYGFPHNAEIWLEAHRQNLWMQWSWGTVSAMRVPPERRLVEFDVPDGVIFRIRIVHPKGPEHHKLLGEVDQIQPIKAGEADDRRRHLIVPIPDALDQVLWRLNFDQEPPQLLVNRDAKPTWKEMALSPHFVSLVYPEVLRQVLTEILVGEDAWTEDDETGWQSDWVRFARNLGGVPSVPPLDQEDERKRWIIDAVAAFSRRMQSRSVWDREFDKETGR